MKPGTDEWSMDEIPLAKLRGGMESQNVDRGEEELPLKILTRQG